LKIGAYVLALVSATMVFPLGLAFYYRENPGVFLAPMAFSWAAALVMNLATRHEPLKISGRDGYLVVALCWVFASLISAVPFLLSGRFPSVIDAVFESVSGITTTGATILSDIEGLPVGVGVWRCQLHWLGGLGIIGLTVALMPLLGIGGFQLIKAETSGPDKTKITAKIADTAKILWIIYASLTAAQTVLLMLAGMSFPDAIAHAFSILGAGGFSTRNDSLASFASTPVNIICTIFMFLAAVNFSLYYALFRFQFRSIVNDTEFKAFLVISSLIILALTLIILPAFGSLGGAFLAAAFHSASLISTTGLAFTDYSQWHALAQPILMMMLALGGCSGSAAGGIKIVRWVVMAKQMRNQFRRFVHPRQVYSISLNKRMGRTDLVYSVAAFFFLYALLTAATAVVASFSGIDLYTSVGAALAIVGNVGLGLGRLGPSGNYAFFHDGAKLWFCAAMIAGRLELWTVALLFSPALWRGHAA
jgi:trk system potassium uptake protein TrkH